MELNEQRNVYSRSAIRLLEKKAEEVGISSYELMQRAGDAIFRVIKKNYPTARRIAIVIGGGNNGGDGLVAAAFLHNAEYMVTVLQVTTYHGIENVLSKIKNDKVPYYPFRADFDFSSYDLILDGICGIGLNQTLREDTQLAIDKINNTRLPILAIDIPTGIDADTGESLGRAVKANSTVTFIGIKQGLVDGEGIQFTGEIILDDLRLPPSLFQSVEKQATISILEEKIKYLPKRHLNWHKGLSGHVLIIGGAPGFSGAPKMAALAALRVGAGLVSVLTHEENAATFDNDHPEIMCHHFKEHDERSLANLTTKATVIVIGPGLSTDIWGQKLFHAVLASNLPILLDADALNLLAMLKTPIRKDNWVLTPHVGEAARLLKQTTTEIQKSRISSARMLAAQFGGVSVLKGARTCITEADKCEISLLGNPGMSTAGLGDILSGVIGGLMAQGLSNWQAATLGVTLHGKAGDLAALNGMRGMIATDLLPYIRKLINA